MARRSGGKNNSSKHFVFAEHFMVLPHENGDEFELLHQRLIEEWKPVGALEEDTVLTPDQLHLAKTSCRTFL